MIQESDNYIYDTSKHRYILTKQGVLNLTGYDISVELQLQTKQDEDRELDRISRDIYNFVYTRNTRVIPSRWNYKQKLEYAIFINNNEEVEAIINAMAEQSQYTMQSGGNLMINEYQQKDQILTDQQRLELLISPLAKLTLASYGLSQGYNMVTSLTEDNYREGY